MKACFRDFRVIETGIRHGTLTVIIDGMQLEITTYRNDGEYLDNRHPVQVTFSEKIEDDLSRRDFTVNAMAYHPQKGLVDLFGGRKDLEARIIRCVGDAQTRFEEDGLRILRAIRFASVLNFEIDEDTAKAIHNCRNLLAGIAAERIREEFCKLICGRGAVRILRDYIDVVDLAKAHVVAITRMVEDKNKQKYEIFNVGTGNGVSVLELVESFQRVNELKLNYKIAPRRPGDVVAIWADTTLANEELGWKAERSLDDTLRSAWAWEKNVRGIK
jgi:tRNA nucleotidyltransferase (CCA-adding enzyme)